jgi:hypothetical protein
MDPAGAACGGAAARAGGTRPARVADATHVDRFGSHAAQFILEMGRTMGQIATCSSQPRKKSFSALTSKPRFSNFQIQIKHTTRFKYIFSFRRKKSI